ncbi:MAG: nucleotidyltransferase domain-containing protein, partial [Candidatus Odinarchaeia archaeon]
MREKTVKIGDDKEVIYTKEHWDLLKTLREKAKLIMKTLTENNIQGFLHGSLVRGDVNKKS